MVLDTQYCFKTNNTAAQVSGAQAEQRHQEPGRDWALVKGRPQSE